MGRKSKPGKGKKLATFDELMDDVQHLNMALNVEKDFPCVLVCTSFLDEALGAILTAHFADAECAEQLINGYIQGPLASFKWRSVMAYCLGLISTGAYKNLDTIRVIRNLFGHAKQSISFDTPEISELCHKLTFPNRTWDPLFPETAFRAARNRFTAVASSLYGTFITCHSNVKRITKLSDGWDQSSDGSTSTK